MSPRVHPVPVASLVLLAALAHPGLAVPIDGRLDASYGPARSVQTTQTLSQDNPSGFGGADSIASAFGSELDAGYAVLEGGSLELFVAGNVMSYSGEFPHQSQLLVFIDCRPGGQNPLRADNADVGYFPDSKLNTFAGLAFDPEFVPDYWFDCTVGETAPRVYGYAAELLAAGGGSGQFLGRSAAGGPGLLTGGTNPDGVLVTIDNSNSAGVTSGCQAATPGDVRKGVEWSIPLAALGNPSGAVKICAFIAGVYGNGWLWNQVLGPLPPGTCGLGAPAAVNFGAIPGAQYFVIEITPVAAHEVSWGRLKAWYR